MPSDTSRRVLCLDDDVVIAKMVADVVRFCGHEPIIEVDAVSAVIKYGHADLGAAIVDLMMPKLDGVEVLAALMESSPKTRRVLLTAAPEEEAARRGLAEGIVQMLISKPPTIHDLRLALAWM